MAGRYDELLVDWPGDVPFERVVRQRLDAFDSLVAQGVTWPSIAAALARAGITKKDGAPLSWRQVNAVYRRNKVKPTRSQALPSASPKPLPMPARSGNSTVTHMSTSGRLADRLREARKFNKSPSAEYEE